MVIIVLGVLGLLTGSFLNALVWRLYKQLSAKTKKKDKKFSIIHGRSMCTHCKHELSAIDLVPVLSWVFLRGRCRYCKQPISWQYPLVELLTAGLFVASYIFWPEDVFGGFNPALNFMVWLVVLSGFIALVVYDFKWMLLPNRIIYPLMFIALGLAVFNIVSSEGLDLLYKTFFSVIVAGGLFYVLFLVSGGRWIGGGDVKLGFLIGFILADPYKSFLMLLASSIIGTLVVLPGMLLGKVTPKTRIPFGPFLIVAAIVIMLFGDNVIDWYVDTLTV